MIFRLKTLFSCLEGLLSLLDNSNPDKKPPAGYESLEDFYLELECLTLVRNGNPRKAYRIMKEWRVKKGDALKGNKFATKLITNVNNEGNAKAKLIRDHQKKMEKEGDYVAMSSEVSQLMQKCDVVDNNCFLNSIIQCLWNLSQLRSEFPRISQQQHYHIGSPCVICSLYASFNALSDGKEVDPNPLRSNLSKFYAESMTPLLQMAEKNDGSELLNAILNCSHLSSSTYLDSISGVKFNSCTVECTNDSCLAYSVFQIDYLERISCETCGYEPKFSNYKSFIRLASASTLRELKVIHANESLSELLSRDDSDVVNKSCEGCGNNNDVHRRLVSTPKVFTLALKWQSRLEDIESIKATLAVLDTEVHMSVVYSSISPQPDRLQLKSMVCFCRFRRNIGFTNKHGVWFIHEHDDSYEEEIGSWESVVAKCIRMHMQPSLLFFEV